MNVSRIFRRSSKLFLLSSLAIMVFLTCTLHRGYSNVKFVKSYDSTSTSTNFRALLNSNYRTSETRHGRDGASAATNHKTSRNEISNWENTYHQAPTKYLFVLHYYEQLGRATGNLFDLASVGKYGNRKISLPFVNNSRLSGVPYKVNIIDHLSSKALSKSYSSLSTYYDVGHFNHSLLDRGYSTFVSLEDFKAACHKRIDVMVHFFYPDVNSLNSTRRWFNISEATLRKIIVTMKERGGWLDCTFLNKNQLIKEMSGITVERLLCVDPTSIISPEVLEIVMFGKKKCAGVLFWKGSGEKDRTRFPLHPKISNRLHSSDLRHSDAILDAANVFVAQTFKSEYISVHIRAEKLLLDFGVKRTFDCLEAASLLVNEIRETYALSRIFLSTDFSTYGSDTFVALTKFTEFKSLLDHFVDSLDKRPEMFSPNKTLDKGVVSLIEMNILRQGSFLVTVGRGYFHNWVVEYFLRGRTSAQIQQVCNEKP